MNCQFYETFSIENLGAEITQKLPKGFNKNRIFGGYQCLLLPQTMAIKVILRYLIRVRLILGDLKLEKNSFLKISDRKKVSKLWAQDRKTT